MWWTGLLLRRGLIKSHVEQTIYTIPINVISQGFKALYFVNGTLNLEGVDCVLQFSGRKGKGWDIGRRRQLNET